MWFSYRIERNICDFIVRFWRKKKLWRGKLKSDDRKLLKDFQLRFGGEIEDFRESWIKSFVGGMEIGVENVNEVLEIYWGKIIFLLMKFIHFWRNKN